MCVWGGGGGGGEKSVSVRAKESACMHVIDNRFSVSCHFQTQACIYIYCVQMRARNLNTEKWRQGRTARTADGELESYAVTH